MQITFALLFCLACALARPQHSKRHRRHQEHTMNEKSQFNNDNSGNAVEHFIPIETCDVSSPCSDHGVCIFIKKGVARCHCEEGYFGARCEIGKRLPKSSGVFYRRNGATGCPLKQFCMPDDVQCFFKDCPGTKGHCIPEPNLSSVPPKKQDHGIGMAATLHDSAEDK